MSKASASGLDPEAVHLGSDASSYVTGEIITVDSGFADSAL